MPYKDINRRREASRRASQRWREANPEKARKARQEWGLKHKHPCPVCGGLVNYGYTHCRKHRTMPCGDKACNWKGGRIKDGQGYILIYKPDHPRADKRHYVREHILTWERVNGKSLPKDWHVHHLNGITDDNRPVNLVGLPRKSHLLLLSAKAKRIQELEALLNNQQQLL